MNNENDLRIEGKLQFFLDEKVKVHVSRNDKQFWNGYLTERKNNDVFIFKEDKLGFCHLFVSDVWEVEEFRRVGG